MASLIRPLLLKSPLSKKKKKKDFAHVPHGDERLESWSKESLDLISSYFELLGGVSELCIWITMYIAVNLFDLEADPASISC